jgi:hypothetical protein
VKHKNDLLAESNKRQDTDEDFTKTEKTLKDRLETMTKMAQKIDDENRLLMKTNQELHINLIS